MGRYKLRICPSALDELAGLPVKARRRLIALIRKLVLEPRPYSSERLSGESKYRLRQGDNRIVYSIDDDSGFVLVVMVGPRQGFKRT